MVFQVVINYVFSKHLRLGRLQAAWLQLRRLETCSDILVSTQRTTFQLDIGILGVFLTLLLPTSAEKSARVCLDPRPRSLERQRKGCRLCDLQGEI
jgi:hypothetical protein